MLWCILVYEAIPCTKGTVIYLNLNPLQVVIIYSYYRKKNTFVVQNRVLLANRGHAVTVYPHFSWWTIQNLTISSQFQVPRPPYSVIASSLRLSLLSPLLLDRVWVKKTCWTLAIVGPRAKHKACSRKSNLCPDASEPISLVGSLPSIFIDLSRWQSDSN